MSAAALMALHLVFGLNISCTAVPGTVVAALLTKGGDGNPVTYRLTGDTSDFVITGTQVVVGQSGINRIHCGTTQTVNVTATQG